MTNENQTNKLEKEHDGMEKFFKRIYRQALCNVAEFFDWGDKEIMALDIAVFILMAIGMVAVAYQLMF